MHRIERQVIVELLDGSLYIGTVYTNMMSRSTFVLHLDKNYHQEGLPSVLIASCVVKDFAILKGTPTCKQ